jgi:sugar phosphate permease
VITLGMLLSAGGLLLLTGARPGGSYAAQVLPGGVLSALGLGLALVPSTIAAVSGVSGSQSGLASGLLNTSRLIGGALGLAVLSTIAASQTHADLHAGGTGVAALSNGFQLAFAVAAAVSLLGAFVALVLMRPTPAAPTGERRLALAAAPARRRLAEQAAPSARRAIHRTRVGARALTRR